MRMLIAIPLLLAAACAVENDRRNGQTTISVDDSILSNAADDFGNAARDAGNELEQAGDRLQNEVRGVDVDVDVRRRDEGDASRNATDR